MLPLLYWLSSFKGRCFPFLLRLSYPFVLSTCWRHVTIKEWCIVIWYQRIFFLQIRRKHLPWRQLILDCQFSSNLVLHSVDFWNVFSTCYLSNPLCLFISLYLIASISLRWILYLDSRNSLLHGSRGSKTQLWLWSIRVECWCCPLLSTLLCTSFLGRFFSLFITIGNLLFIFLPCTSM